MENDEQVKKEIINRKIGIIGVGQMGSALLIAFSKYIKKYFNNFQDVFYLCDPNLDKNKEFKQYGFTNVTNEEGVFLNAKIIFISVKPDIVGELIKRNSHLITPTTMLVSIAAGISIQILETLLGQKTVKIVRIMANHLALINESASVYSINSHCDSIDEKIVYTLLQKIGIIKKISEKLMNTFTALAGSGPAFIYYFAESLVDASLRMGIDVDTAREYVKQVLYGASKYLKNSEVKNPNNIKYVVTTPNGTTIAGLAEMDKYGFKHTINKAIEMAAKRGAQIAKEKLRMFSRTKF